VHIAALHRLDAHLCGVDTSVLHLSTHNYGMQLASARLHAVSQLRQLSNSNGSTDLDGLCLQKFVGALLNHRYCYRSIELPHGFPLTFGPQRVIQPNWPATRILEVKFARSLANTSLSFKLRIRTNYKPQTHGLPYQHKRILTRLTDQSQAVFPSRRVVSVSRREEAMP
jgi:hypothetical protein